MSMNVTGIFGASGPTIPSSGILTKQVLVMNAGTPGLLSVATTTPGVKVVGVAQENVSPNNEVAYTIIGDVACISDGNAVINPGDYIIPSVSVAGSVRAYTPANGTNVKLILGLYKGPQIAATAGLDVGFTLTMHLFLGA